MEATPQETGRAPAEPEGDPRPRPGKGVLGFFAVVVLLYALPGAGAQSLSAPLGLAWTQLFVFLLPAWAAAAGSNLRPRDFLLLERRPTAGQVVLGLLCGAAAFPVANGLMALSSAALPESWVREFDLSRLFQCPPLERAGIALAASLLAPLCEEAAFRGYVQGALLTRRRPGAAMVLSALLFALMHLDPVRFPAVLALGAFFGWLAWRAGSLWPAVAAHAANNGIGSAIMLATEAEPVPAAPEVHQALFLAAAGAGVLAVFAALYRLATPAPPTSAAPLVRLDPADPSVRFRWFKVPPSLLGLGALGLALLLGMAAFAGARK
ncbi:MAG TPA: type II CAAX endopeptidase family protein [Anaeromyxobacteraceae bacterium]